MAASRPIWKGQLRLSLVSINVEMFPAHKSGATTAFNQIHKPSGKRIHYQKVVEGIGPVEAKDIRKGYQYDKGEYVLLEDEELDAVKLETKKTLDLVQFVDETEIPPLYYDSPYFVAPADDLAEDAFRVVRDALRKSKKVGLGQLALRGKEYLVAIKPCGKGMLLETLHYEAEIKKADSFFSDIPAKSADDDLLEVATALIDKKTDRFDPKIFKDHYQAALRELIQRKLKSKGRKIEVEDDKPARQTGNVIDLMAALKKSLDSGARTPAKKAAATKAPARKAAKKAPARKKAS
ncbi:MAG: Ku protein [Devosia sp.]|uniref:non-homologous end joining protein Ku n=1 Tax=Devosia sp. TaxID=1871048 RepID=UPI001A507152|nr:Ku protein [Devosia sp.]MBL8597004.1 Ku protein [Devosia sp.]